MISLKARIRPLRLAVLGLLFFTFGCGGEQIAPIHADLGQTGLVQTLLDLLGKQDNKFTPEEIEELHLKDFENTSLKYINPLATPAGYRIHLRYTQFGISLVESLHAARDPELKRRLIEMAQWSREPAVRAEAIVTLAGYSDPSHKKYIKSALLDGKVNMRFAAVEALQVWNQDETIPLLTMTKDRDWSPLMRIWAAQALLSLGQESAIDALWKGLDDNSWVIRAMAARYLGDYAKPEDYQRIVSYLDRETKDDFVIAELSIAALKLISKKGESISYSPASKGWKDNEEVKYTVGKNGTVELEPLVIVPPRLHIPQSLQVESQINSQLLRLLKTRLDVKPDEMHEQDPVAVQELNTLVTPTGFALSLRYSRLSYLLIEGLAGSSDPLIRLQLQQMATSSDDSLVRATSLMSLAYTRDQQDIFLIQDALRYHTRDALTGKDSAASARVRFAAMEAIEAGRFDQLVPQLYDIAHDDPAPALQVYAAQVLARFGDPSGRQLLIAHLDDQDWPARAMAYWYLSRYGTESDYTIALARLPTEKNPFVQSEICLALLRLAPL